MKISDIYENESEARLEQLKKDIADGKTVKVVMASSVKGKNSIGDLMRMKLVNRYDTRGGTRGYSFDELHRTYEVVGDVKFTVDDDPKVYTKGDTVDGGWWDPT